MAALQQDRYTQPEFNALEQRIEAQNAAYWRARIGAMLERLEREARRMFQLEEELSEFANRYYDAVGEVTERLAQVEQKIASVSMPVDSAMPAVLAHRDARDARKVELKRRYRNLAKEMHPDRQMVTEGTGTRAGNMRMLNAAYQHGDLAALLKLEAEMLINPIATGEKLAAGELEQAVRDIERAADTYADGYRNLLNSPLNELMLRAMQARLAGWDWVQAVVRKVERTIEEKERAAVIAHIAEIGEWRTQVQTS